MSETRKAVFYVNGDGGNEAEMAVWIEQCFEQYNPNNGEGDDRYMLEVEVSVKLIDNFDETRGGAEEFIRRIEKKWGCQHDL